MSHPSLENETGLAFETMFLADENGWPICVPIVKATYVIGKNDITLAETQSGLFLEPDYTGEAPDSSERYEAECAFVKLSTDVVLIGHGYAPKVGAQSVDAGLKVGPLQKIVRVFGNRYWTKIGGSIVASRAEPFERVPLIYERAFGGWDKSSKDEKDWRCDLRNPVGRGYGDPLRYVEKGRVPIPNLEDPQQLIKRYGDAPSPAGFGFVSPHWQPRAQHAGTYDESWDQERKPLLPLDFDRRFFNAASPGMIASTYLTGDEDVVVVNASPVPQLRFRLPGLPPPDCRVNLRKGQKIDLALNLDTVIINTDEMLLFLIWRAFTPVKNGPLEVVAVQVSQEQTARRVRA